MKTIMSCGCAANGTCSKMGEVNFNPPIPCCVIHDCIEIASTQPDLANRMARCCDKSRLLPSSPDLAFFEYQGPGSPDCEDICKICGYRKIAHKDGANYRGELNKHVCENFTPRGPLEHDRYYCGHSGWD